MKVFSGCCLKKHEMMGTSSGCVLKAEGQPTLYIMGNCVWNGALKRM
ncbi:hypothetical protein [uncultured Bacteroides sp.]|nr:hypothetical protein [uncultured Bacteroides sp.]